LTIAEAAKDAGQRVGPEGALRWALEQLTTNLLGREWRREDGGDMRVNLALIDAGYQTKLIYAFCRASPHAAILRPSHGRGLGPASRPMAEYHRYPGDTKGHHWHMSRGPASARTMLHVLVDVGHWKGSLHQRLATSPGDPGALTLWGHERRDHVLWADHITAEAPVRTSGARGEVDVWKQRPNRDNDWLDAAVLASVAASICGAVLTSVQAAPTREKKKRVKLSELQRQRQADPVSWR
jgi:phage terminase large subunit GpA-like protein